MNNEPEIIDDLAASTGVLAAIMLQKLAPDIKQQIVNSHRAGGHLEVRYGLRPGDIFIRLVLVDDAAKPPQILCTAEPEGTGDPNMVTINDAGIAAGRTMALVINKLPDRAKLEMGNAILDLHTSVLPNETFRAVAYADRRGDWVELGRFTSAPE